MKSFIELCERVAPAPKRESHDVSQAGCTDPGGAARERVTRPATRERNDVSETSRNDAGSSLVEVVVAMLIMATLAAGLLSMTAIALTQSENQGHLAARTAEYAQDKMEQLLVLSYGDQVTDTRVFPALPLGGTGLAIGGSSNPGAPALGYADYLDQNGNLLVSNTASPPAGWFYQRVWQVTAVTPTLKEVRVTATVARAIGRTRRPTATLVSLKTFPF